MARFYDLAVWRQARRTYLDEHPLCEICQRQGHVVPALHVDHIVPITQGGEMLHGDNLQALCLPCHSKKTSADEGGAVRWGCDVHGIPIDPSHPWSQARG